MRELQHLSFEELRWLERYAGLDTHTHMHTQAQTQQQSSPFGRSAGAFGAASSSSSSSAPHNPQLALFSYINDQGTKITLHCLPSSLAELEKLTMEDLLRVIGWKEGLLPQRLRLDLLPFSDSQARVGPLTTLRCVTRLGTKRSVFHQEVDFLVRMSQVGGAVREDGGRSVLVTKDCRLRSVLTVSVWEKEDQSTGFCAVGVKPVSVWRKNTITLEIGERVCVQDFVPWFYSLLRKRAMWYDSRALGASVRTMITTLDVPSLNTNTQTHT
jgi:hypothetical protein